MSINSRGRLLNMIKRFKFEEMESAVLPCFPEVSWNDIKLKLIKHHYSFSVKNVVCIIDNAIDDAKLKEKDLKDRLSMLQVIDVSRHSHRKTWYAYVLKDCTASVDFPTHEHFQKSIIQACHTLDVKIVTHDIVTYISVTEKHSKRQVKHTMPAFFALFLGQKYFFSSKKSVPKNYIMAVTNSLGYANSMQLKLMGKDLKSLLKLLWAKEQTSLDASDIINPPVYKIATPLIKSTGVDCTQYEQRRAYVKKCFGDKPPTLELLVINGPDEPWIAEDVSQNMPNETVHAGWEFRSRNIATFLTKLTEKRIFTVPLPQYVSNLMVIGKNNLKLEHSETK